MARLPNVASDLNAWGEILNEYLTVGHREDGTHRLGWVVTEHGAVGDGVTDCADAINTVIQGSAEGDAIVFPGGTYLVSTPIYLLPNRVYFGMGRPVIKQQAGTNLDSLLTTSDPDANLTSIAWSGIDLDGNQENVTQWPTSPPVITATMDFASNTTGWSATGGTISHDAGVGNSAPGSLKLTATTTGDIEVESPLGADPNGIPVMWGRTYVFTANVQPDVTPQNIQVAIDWYDDTATLLSTSLGDEWLTEVGNWVSSYIEVEAPVGAVTAKVRMMFKNATSGDFNWMDDALFTESFDRNHAMRVSNMRESLVENCAFRNFGNHGIYLTGLGYENRLINVTVHNVMNTALFVGEDVQETQALSCVFGAANGAVELSGRRNILEACTVNATALAGVRVWADGCTVRNCQIATNGREGIYAGEYADYLMIVGNNIYANSTESDDTYDGILLAGTVSKSIKYVTITGNLIYSNNAGGDGKHRRGITLGQYHQYVVVDSNNIDNNDIGGTPDPDSMIADLAEGDIYNGLRIMSDVWGTPTNATDGEDTYLNDVSTWHRYSALRARWERVPTMVQDFQAGQAACVAAATFVDITIPDMGGTNYTITAIANWSTTVYLSSRTATLFRVWFGTAVPGAGARWVDWTVTRHA